MYMYVYVCMYVCMRTYLRIFLQLPIESVRIVCPSTDHSGPPDVPFHPKAIF